MFDRYAQFLLKNRVWFILGALGLCTFMASPLIPPDRIRFDFSFKRLFRFEGEEAAQLTHFKNLFGDDAGTTGVLFVAQTERGRRPPALAPPVALAMLELEEWLATRDELDEGFTHSPVNATDFYAEPVRPEALARVLEKVLEADIGDEELWEIWLGDTPLPSPLAEYERVAGRIMQHELYRGMLFSPDGRASTLAFRFSVKNNHPSARRELLSGFKSRVDGLRERFRDRVEVHAYGIPFVTEEYTNLSVRDIALTAPLSVAIMTLFLFLLFRTALATILPQIVVMLAVVCAVGFMQMTDEPLNIISHIVPVIVLVVGVADAVHILSRYSEERRLGRNSREAVRRTVAMLSKACFLTSATTAIGFASLYTATIATIASFGIYTAAAVMFTYVVNMTLLPIGLSLSRSVPREPFAAARVKNFLEAMARFAIAHAKAIFVSAVIFAVVSVVIVIAGLDVNNHLLEEVPASNPVYRATVAMESHLSPVMPYDFLVEGRVYGETRCRADADCENGSTGVGDDRICVTAGKTRRALSPIREGFAGLVDTDEMLFFDSLEEHMNAGLPEDTGVCAESVKNPRLLRALDLVAQGLMEDPEVRKHLGRVESLSATVKQMHSALKQGAPGSFSVPETRAAVSQALLPIETANQGLLDRSTTLDYDATRMTLLLRDHGSSAWETVKARLDALAAEHIDGDKELSERYSHAVTGTMTFVERALSFIVHDMLLSLSTAFFFIFLLMVLLFRSLRIGLLSILPNIFPLVTTLLLMTVAGIELRTATIIIFSISLGIAVNDTIHFIARYNEELARDGDPEASIVRAMASAGKAMVITTLILAGGFLIDLVCEFVALQQFGYLASFTLVMALVGDLVVLPACLVLFGPRGSRAAPVSERGKGGEDFIRA